MLGRPRTCCLLRLDWRIFLVVGFGLVFLWPTLRTGWVNDDCICATLPGNWIFNQTSWAAETWDRIRVWVLNWGRLTPLIHVLVSATFGLLPNLAAYKWTMLGLVLVNLAVFYHFLKTVGASPNLAAV